jgi:hypothetical protein
MPRWVRAEGMPNIIRISLNIPVDKQPELAAWIWSLPHGTVTTEIHRRLKASIEQDGFSFPVTTEIKSQAKIKNTTKDISKRISPTPSDLQPETGILPDMEKPSLPVRPPINLSTGLPATESGGDAVGRNALSAADIKKLNALDSIC